MNHPELILIMFVPVWTFLILRIMNNKKQSLEKVE